MGTGCEAHAKLHIVSPVYIEHPISMQKGSWGISNYIEEEGQHM